MLSWEYPPHVVGGLAAHVQGLARALVAGGHEVTVLTQDASAPKAESDEGVEVLRAGAVPINPPDFMSYVHQMNQQLLSKAAELLGSGRDFDIIHAHDWLVAFAAGGLKQSMRRPLIATIHATEYGRNGGLHNDQQRHISDIEWWLVYEAWRVIVCSEAMTRELEHVFQVPQDKVLAIPNGVDAESVIVERDLTLRRQLASDDEAILFFVGRLVFEKGVDVLLQAFRYLLAVRPATKLVIAGKGPIQADLEEMARQLGIADRVHFAGYVDAKTRNRFLSISDAAIFPSRYEPFGIVALEAMAAGVPVVAGNVGGLREIIADGEDGWLVAPGDAGALSATLYTLLDDAARARRMTEAAKRKVAETYTWASVAKQTASLYSKVLEESSQSDWIQLPPPAVRDTVYDRYHATANRRPSFARP